MFWIFFCVDGILLTTISYAIVSYDLTFAMADGKEVVLHHKVTPFRLCKNGNMWLGLCYVTVSSGKDNNKQAIFYNSESGERYKLVDGEFAFLDSGAITREDVQILTLLAKGFSDKEIGSALGRMNQ